MAVERRLSAEGFEASFLGLFVSCFRGDADTMSLKLYWDRAGMDDGMKPWEFGQEYGRTDAGWNWTSLTDHFPALFAECWGFSFLVKRSSCMVFTFYIVE